jgi:predicted acylesterase/phospholipase RssA
MKGGITSGVVYPLAAAELAEHYAFRNIGGTSAGAIAAAAVAAAEHGRRSGDNEAAFERIAELPNELGKDLKSLFQPYPEMRPFFELLLAAGQGSAGSVLAALLGGFPRAVALGALPGLALIVLAVAADGDALLRLAVAAVGVLALLVGPVLAIVVAACRRLRCLPDRYFGLCPGNDRDGDATQQPLTRWLTELLDELAGKRGSGPLTFGDLWALEAPDGERGVNLQTITTCLTQGRPYSLPFEPDEQLWFSEDQFLDLFPAKVVDHMVAESTGTSKGADGEELHLLPPPEQLPVVVAARMSLSFPLLIGAVPLYARNARKGAGNAPERCWFSDGGITSNMPIHFFDSPVPRWPTFAIDLEQLPPGQSPSPKEADNVWLVEDNRDGVAESWIGWEGKGSFGRSGAFLLSIFRTAQNWIDNRQMKGVGNRDRIAHVRLADYEGGMNIEMAEETITKLGERGAHAAKRLVERFDPERPVGAPMGWDNQRWLRFRAYLELVERRGRLARRGYAEQGNGTAMGDLNGRAADAAPEYAWGDSGQHEFAVEASEALLAAFEAWERSGQSFAEDAPGPPTQPWAIPRI